MAKKFFGVKDDDEFFRAYCYVLDFFSLHGREEEVDNMTNDEIIQIYLNRDKDE